MNYHLHKTLASFQSYVNRSELKLFFPSLFKTCDVFSKWPHEQKAERVRLKWPPGARPGPGQCFIFHSELVGAEV